MSKPTAPFTLLISDEAKGLAAVEIPKARRSLERVAPEVKHRRPQPAPKPDPHATINLVDVDAAAAQLTWRFRDDRAAALDYLERLAAALAGFDEAA